MHTGKSLSMRPIATSMVIRAPVLPIPALKDQQNIWTVTKINTNYTRYNQSYSKGSEDFSYLQWTTTGPGPSARRRKNRTNSTNSTADYKQTKFGMISDKCTLMLTKCGTSEAMSTLRISTASIGVSTLLKCILAEHHG